MDTSSFSAVMSVFALVLGACIGSFLNVCIHRLPRGLKVGDPVRSFCPACEKTIPWYHNLPVVSWLALGGRCAQCKTAISPRYLAVELLTAVAFWATWQRYELPVAPVLWVFLALMIAATFIDLEHLIIPNEITLGGAALGLLLSALVPMVHEVPVWWESLLLSALGAGFGYLLVWGIVEAGKLAFGKKRIVLSPAEPFSLAVAEDTATISLGEDQLPWEDLFSRPTDELVLEVSSVTLNDEAREARTIRIRYDRAWIGDSPELPIEQCHGLSGIATAAVIPREAMGFGDVKFMACIGAFIGWKGVLFTLFASSVVGSLIGVAVLLATRGKQSARIPYGPFLALGAVAWIFGGQELARWYLATLGH